MIHVYCIPLVNVQQIMLGYERQYLRIEEAFVGPQGTFTMLTGSMSKTDLFIDSLKLAYRRAIPDIDQYEDLHIMINPDTDVNLRQTLNRIEGLDKPGDIAVVMYMLVSAIDFTHMSRPWVTHSLVITSRYLYLLREDYIMWPEATFAIGPSTRPQFEVACAFPIMGRISGIQMYDSDTYSPDHDTSLSQTFIATKSSAMVVPHFIGFGVKLMFDMGSQGQQKLDIRVSTSGMRDRFLATLTQVRREMSARSPSPTKPAKGSRGKAKPHREVDTDSMSSSSGGSGQGARPRHTRTPHTTSHQPTHRPHQNVNAHNNHGAKHHTANKTENPCAYVTQSEHPTGRQGLISPVADQVVLHGHHKCMEQDYFSPKNGDSSEEGDDPSDMPMRDSPTGESGSPVESIPDEFMSANSDGSGEKGSVQEQFSDLCKVSEEDADLCKVSEEDTDLCKVSQQAESNLQVCEIDASHETIHQFSYGGDTETSPNKIEACGNEAMGESGLHVSQETKQFKGDGGPGGGGETAELPRIRTSPPSTLGVQYPSLALITHLSQCNEQMPLLQPLSPSMQNLVTMMGDELLNLFHSTIAQIGADNEEMRHILWAPVITYSEPDKEVATCVMLSTKAVYFVADKPAGDTSPLRTTAAKDKTHTRVRSDSYQVLLPKSQSRDLHHSSGIIYGLDKQPEGLRAYSRLSLRDLKEVTLGMFDQSFRLVGSGPSGTFTCVTRDTQSTELFIKQLMQVLALIDPTPSPDCPLADSMGEQDFYQMFTKYNHSESQEYRHPSKVRFVYPSEDSVSDLTYLVLNNIKGKRPKVAEVNLLMSLMLFQVNFPEGSTGFDLDLTQCKPRTLVLSEQYVSLAMEDHIHYPILDFSRGPPAHPRSEIQEVASLENLQRITMSDFQSHDVTLVWTDESADIVVDMGVDYYSDRDGTVAGASDQTPEVLWTLVIQSLRDKDRLIKLIQQQWKEMHEGQELSVQVSS
jgi:hypothetical protein